MKTIEGVAAISREGDRVLGLRGGMASLRGCGKMFFFFFDFLAEKE